MPQLWGDGLMLLTIPARSLQRGDVALGSRQRVVTIRNGGAGKMCLTLERMSGPNAGTLRVAEWNRGTRIGIHRPEPCEHCGGSGVRPGTVGAGCGKCEHGKTPPPFPVSPAVPSETAP